MLFPEFLWIQCPFPGHTAPFKMGASGLWEKLRFLPGPRAWESPCLPRLSLSRILLGDFGSTPETIMELELCLLHRGDQACDSIPSYLLEEDLFLTHTTDPNRGSGMLCSCRALGRHDPGFEPLCPPWGVGTRSEVTLPPQKAAERCQRQQPSALLACSRGGSGSLFSHVFRFKWSCKAGIGNHH